MRGPPVRAPRRQRPCRALRPAGSVRRGRRRLARDDALRARLGIAAVASLTAQSWETISSVSRLTSPPSPLRPPPDDEAPHSHCRFWRRAQRPPPATSLPPGIHWPVPALPMCRSLALAAPRFNRLACRAYLAAINGTPRLWSGFYAWVDRSRIFPRHLWMLFAAPEMRALDVVLASQRARRRVSTYPLYAFMLERSPARAGWRAVLHVVTDSITINSLWTRRLQCWSCQRGDAEVMRGMGVPPDRSATSGFPVAGFFQRASGDLGPPDLAPARFARSLHHPLGVPAWLGERPPAARRDRMGAHFRRSGATSACAAGLGPAGRGRSRPRSVLGWTNEVPRLLMTHHIVHQQGRRRHPRRRPSPRAARCSSPGSSRDRRRAIMELLPPSAARLVETPDAGHLRAAAGLRPTGRRGGASGGPPCSLAVPMPSRAIAAHLLARAAITAA